MNLRSLYEQDGYWNKAKFLLASHADKPSFAQTRCAQTVRSVTAASAKLVTKLDQGSRIRPVMILLYSWNISRETLVSVYTGSLPSQLPGIPLQIYISAMKRYGMRQPLQEFEKFLEMFWLCYA